MLLFEARPVDGRVDYEVRVQEKIDHLETLTDADGKPDYEAINAYIDGKDEWKTGVKEFYFKAQGKKCGYCERFVTDYGDVEHYRPKRAIYTLEAAGEERANLNNVSGRKFHSPPESGTYDSGYWWLAYDWDNYLVSCGICNQVWKNALFPVKYGHRRRPEKGDDDSKDPYLLDPFGTKDPAQHLEFTAAGAIRAYNESRYGEETISVCGLGRASVVASRLEKADKVHDKLVQLHQAFVDGTNPRSILKDIFHLGDPKWAHAGMVRITFEQSTGWTWADLEQWLIDNP